MNAVPFSIDAAIAAMHRDQPRMQHLRALMNGTIGDASKHFSNLPPLPVGYHYKFQSTNPELSPDGTKYTSLLMAIPTPTVHFDD